jgi:hypothetical protein
MTKVLFPILLFALLISLASWVHADTGSESDMNGNSTGPSTMGHTGRRGGGKRLNPDKGSKSTSSVRGTCGTAASTTNPLAGPCVNIELILNDEKGAEIERTRTSQSGRFEFAAKKGTNYRIVSGSKFFEVISPKDLIHGGNSVDLQLRQK